MNSSSSVNHLENKNQIKPNSFIAVCSCVKGFNVAFMVQRGEQREALKVKTVLSADFSFCHATNEVRKMMSLTCNDRPPRQTV